MKDCVANDGGSVSVMVVVVYLNRCRLTEILNWNDS